MANFDKKCKFMKVNCYKDLNLPRFNEKIQVICNQNINYMQMYVVKYIQKQHFSLIKLSILPPYILITLFICFTEQM